MRKQLEKWIVKNFGKRCPEFEEGCACCKAWRCFDYLMETDFNEN